MSSHHIVRDEQEPALLVLGFAESQWQVLQELLEWSPTVLVTSNLAERLLSKGVKIDWTIGDREAVSYEDYQSHIGFLGANEKGELLSALKFLVSRGYHAVNVMAIADQWDAISDYFLGSEVRLHVNVFQGGKRNILAAGNLQKWLKPGIYSLRFRLGNTCNFDGFEPVDSETDGDFVLKKTDAGLVRIECNGPFFLEETLPSGPSTLAH